MTLLNANRLSLQSRPYSTVYPVGVPEKAKRYYHLEAHGLMSAAGLLEEVLLASGLDPRCHEETISLWRDLEDSGRAALSAGAMQIRDASITGHGPDAKAYFRPMRLDGVGVRVAARTLARSCSVLVHDAEAEIYSEILRRDSILPISYISVSLRAGLEIETYHDRTDILPIFVPATAAELASGISRQHDLGPRVLDLVAEAARFEFDCTHLSSDLWPATSQGITVVLVPAAGAEAGREKFEALSRRLMEMEGSSGPWPGASKAWSSHLGLEPSLIAVKIEAGAVVSHSVVLEEVDAEFAPFL